MEGRREIAKTSLTPLFPELGQYRRSLPADFEFPFFVKTFRIAVTGDVPVTQLELDIIDEPDFQRLQGVRQLGTAVRVYPSALHTRFDHSLGCLGMVDRMIGEITAVNNRYKKEFPDQSTISDVQKVLARLYALLHDITHVPFGHTIEDELKVFTEHDSRESPRFERFLGTKSKIAGLICHHLSVDFYERFISIFQKRFDDDGDAFIYDLVSNTVCADLLDYAGRDFYFCNLGATPEYRFLRYLYLDRVAERRGVAGKKDIASGKRVLVRLWKGGKNEPRRDTLTDLTLLLETRYMIAERVYYHHAKIIAGAMITRAIQESKVHHSLSDDMLCEHTDDTLVRFLTQDQKTGDVGRRIALDYRHRRLYKVIKSYQHDDFRPHQSHDHARPLVDEALKELRDHEKRRGIENTIAEEIEAREGDILIYPPDLKMNNKVAEMLVWWEGKVQMFEDINDSMVSERLHSIRTAHEKLWHILLIGHPDLEPEQRNLAIRAFELRFLNTGEGVESRKARMQHAEELIRFHIRRRQDLPAITPREYGERVSATAEYLLTSTRTSGGRRLSINEAIDFVWKQHVNSA